MNLWKLSATKRALIVSLLTLALALSGASPQGIARALADAAEEVGAVEQGAEGTEGKEAAGTDGSEQADATVPAGSGEVDEAAAAPAEAEPKTWRIVLDGNEGLLAEGADARDARIEATEDEAPVTLPDLYEREGYRLAGWSTVADPEAWWEARDAVLAEDPDAPEPDDTPLFVPAGARLHNLSFDYVELEDGTIAQVDAAVADEGRDAQGRAVTHCDLRERAADGELSLYAQWEQVAEPAAEGEAEEPDEKAAQAQASAEESAEPAAQAGEAEAGAEPAESATESADAADAEVVLDAVEQTATIRKLLSAGSAPSTAARSALAGTVPLFAMTAASETPTTLPLTEDGTTVEALSLTWVTEDTLSDGNDANLNLIPGHIEFVGEWVDYDAAISLAAQLQFTLSGERSYEPGSIQISIPAQFVKDREGSLVGALTIDLPEDPDASHAFAYRLVTTSEGGDASYLITNMRTLDSHTTGTITFSYDGITPHELRSGALQEGLQAELTLTTAGGSEIVANSNELTATVSTGETLERVYKEGGTVMDVSDAPEAVQGALDAVARQAGDGTTADDYLLVRWFCYACAKGDQSFTLTMKDALSGSIGDSVYYAIKDAGDNVIDAEGSVVLGTSTDAAASPSSSYQKTVVDNDYIPSYEMRYETVWTAYPLELFESGETYTITNVATWTLTPTDDADNPSTLFEVSSITYTKPTATAFVSPTHYFDISKATLEPHAYATSDNAALNELAAGADTTIGFAVTGTGEIMRFTKAADESTPDDDIAQYISSGTKTVDDYYHQRSVTVELSDDALYLDEDYANELASADYYVSEVGLLDPLVYRYEESDVDGTATWDYVRDTTGRLPDMALYGLSETAGATATEWVELATISYTEDNVRTVSAAAEGVSASDDAVTLAESLGITRVKLVAATKSYDKIQLRYNPLITLRAASPRLASLVSELFSHADTPLVTVRNDATLAAYCGDALSGTGDDAPTIDPSHAQLTSTEAASIIAYAHPYMPTQEMRRTDAMDNARYGQSMEHDSSLAYLRGVVPHVGVTSTKKMAYKAASDLDSTAMQAKLHYSATVHEQSNITSKALYESLVAAGTLVPETSGTWYDLLPVGVEPLVSSVTLRDADAIEDVYTIEDYQGSGRTLLVVKAKLVPVLRYNGTDDYWSEGFYDEPQISFDAVYNYADTEAGSDEYDHLVNVIAFESGNAALGDVDGMIGEPDDATLTGRSAYNNDETAAAVEGVEELMSNLDSELTEKKPTFVYARSDNRIVIERLFTSSTKTVASDAEGIYRTGVGEQDNQVNVHEGQGYCYRISAGYYWSASDVVIYDALEGYVPNGTDSDYDAGSFTWKGALVSVDTSQLEAAGVEPVVYYSTNSSLTSSNISLHTNLQDAQTWSTTPPKDLSKVTAIAIDCSKDAGGNNFTLSYGQALTAYLHMKAPVADEENRLFATSGSGDDNDPDNPDNNAHAFNAAYVVSDFGSSYTDYTKVGILPYKVEVNKTWDDGNDQDGKRPESVTVNLLANGSAATDADGNTVAPVSLGSAYADVDGYSDGGWTYSFTNLPFEDNDHNAIRYSVSEEPLTEGSGEDATTLYTPSYQRIDDTHLQIVNKYVPETVDVCGTKTWDDDDDAAGARPSTIQVRLYANGICKAIQRIAPDASGVWSYAFTDLPANSGGEKIAYVVEEIPVDNYAVDYTASTAGSGSTVAADGTVQGSTDITNSYSTTGMLAIEKTVEGAKSDVSRNLSFSFVVELFEPALTTYGDSSDSSPLPLYGSYPYTVVNAEGAVVRTGSISMGGTLSLTDGQRALISDIPVGSSYTITEQSRNGFSLSSSENTSGTVAPAVSEDQATVVRFTNSYSSSGSFRLSATKVLTGRRLARNQFSFEAYQVFNEGSEDEYEELVSTAGNLAGSALDENGQSRGTVSFARTNVTNDDLGEDGTLTLLYRIREVIPDGATDNGDGTYTAGGYTYPTNVEQVRVTLTDNGNGSITAEQVEEAQTGTAHIVSGDSVTSAAFSSHGDGIFTNSYDVTGSLDLVAYKYLAGRALVADEFSLRLTALTSGAPMATGTDDAGSPVYDSTYDKTTNSMTASNEADGTVSFPTIALDASDCGNSYIYQLTEDAGDDEGVNYSGETFYYLVDVADDGSGTITATTTVVAPVDGADSDKVAAGDPSVFAATGASPTIVNTLKAGSLSIEKQLAEGVSDPSQTGTSFTFRVRLMGSDVADSYDYRVTDSTGDTTVSEGTAAVSDGVLTVSLKSGQKLTISDIAAGTTYQVFEECAEGWQLSTQSAAQGTIEAVTTSAATFTNQLASASDSASTHLYASKTLDGEAPADDAFSFTLTAVTAGAPLPEAAGEGGSLTVANDAAGLVDFGAITYTAAGTYTYTLAEVLPEGVSAESPTKDGISYDTSSPTATVTVTNTGTDEEPVLSVSSVSYQQGTAGSASSIVPVFANTTEPGTLTVTKHGVNVTARNADTSFDFTVELLHDGAPLTQVSRLTANAESPTPESSDTGIYSLKLTPEETVTFTDLPADTTYTVYEASQPGGWTQTESSDTHGTVPAGGSAAASVTNSYAATGAISLQATKKMVSGSLQAGDFAFELLDESGTVLQRVSNHGPGSDPLAAGVLFDQIDYDVTELLASAAGDDADGARPDKRIYSYTIQEVVPDDAVNTDGTTWAEANDEAKAEGGFVYDGIVYGDAILGSPIQTVYVKVADVVGNGQLTVTMVDEAGDELTDEDETTFANNVLTGSLKVSKTALGTNEATKDTVFRFSIYIHSASGLPISGYYPITYYDAEGNEVEKFYSDGEYAGQKITQVTFSESGMTEGITNAKSGEYFVISGLPVGVVYEVNETQSTYGFTQTAATDATGTITADECAEASYECAKASFTNIYAAEGSITLKAQKELEGANIADYSFTFQIYDEDNKLLQTKTTDETGLVSFDEFVFTATEAGTEANPAVYRYKIVEVNDRQKDIVYDTHSGWVEVSVWDDGSDEIAKLTTTATYDHETGAADDQPETFTNSYQRSWKLPFVGGSNLRTLGAIATMIAAAAAALYLRRWQRRD